MSEAVRIRPRYLNYVTDLSGRPYAWKYPSVLSRISFAAILCCFCSSPFVHYVVLGWKPFQTAHGNIMSQQGHHGWVRLTSSTMITVSHMLCCMKCTWRPVLVSTLPLHPYTGKSQGPTSLEKKILYVCGYNTEGESPTELPRQQRTLPRGGPQETLPTVPSQSMGTGPTASYGTSWSGPIPYSTSCMPPITGFLLCGRVIRASGLSY